jgi:hypothetical protein
VKSPTTTKTILLKRRVESLKKLDSFHHLVSKIQLGRLIRNFQKARLVKVPGLQASTKEKKPADYTQLLWIPKLRFSPGKYLPEI